MVYYRAAPQVRTEGADLKTVFEFKNTTKGRLYTNRLDLILEPLAAKYITYTIEKNGIEIYDSKVPRIKYSQLPIRNNIQYLERDERLTIKAASTTDFQPILDFALVAEFDFVDQPYPAAFIPFTTAELLGLSETIQIWNAEPFDQNFNERHYATINTEGYSNLQLLISANEDYNPRILSNEHFALTRTFLDLFEDSYYGNVSALTRSPQMQEGTGNSQTNWNYADNTPLPTFQHNIETMRDDHTFRGKAPVKFDIDETGRFVLTPREFNHQIAMWVFRLSTPFDFRTADTTGQLRRGWNVTEDFDPRHLEIIDLNNVLMIFQATGDTPKIVLYNTNPHLDEPDNTTISLNWEADITSKFTDNGEIFALYIHSAGKKITILQKQAGTTGAIRAITLTSTTPYDFRTTGTPETSEFEHSSDNITKAWFSRDGHQLLFFDTENKQLHKSTNLVTPFKLQSAITFNQTRHLSAHLQTSTLQDLQYRFDGGDLYISYYAQGTNQTIFRRYKFREVGSGWKLYSRDNIPFLPVGYRGNHVTDKITIDLNNPEGQNRQYTISLSDTSRLGIDITYQHPQSIAFEYDPRYTGFGRHRRRTSLGYFIARYAGFRVFSNNIQTLQIFGADTAEAEGTLITKEDSFSGDRRINITTTAKYLQIVKTIAYEISHTTTFHDQTRRSNSREAIIEANRFINTLPTEGYIHNVNRRIGYHDISWPALISPIMTPEYLSVGRNDPLTQNFAVESLTRLPIPVTTITISLEAKKADGTYQTILPTVGTISTLGQSTISLSEQNPTLVLPKGEDALRLKVVTDAQTVLSLDAILSN